MQNIDWIRCPVCGNKTRDRIREDTILRNYPLYCPKCNVVPQIKRNSILHIIRDCFCDVSMNNSRLFDADSALYFI